MSNKFIYLIFILLLILSSTCQKYRKIIHTTDPDAKCLDGSPPAFYIHQGTQPDKFLLYIQGDSYCQGESQSQILQQCYLRSKTQQGSSNLWPQQRQGQGYLSTNSSQSLFSTWTKIILGSCDGALYQGYRSIPIQYKNTLLYFRGSKIMKSHLAYLQRYFNISSSKKILWTGTSIGAISALIWSGYVRTLIKDESKLYIVIDSGLFINVPGHNTQKYHFSTQLQYLYKLANLEESTPLDVCNVFNDKYQWKCFVLEYNYVFLKGNFLFVNSEYDSWALINILQIKSLVNASIGTGYTFTNCTKQEKQAIEKYRNDSLLLLFQILQLYDQSSCWTIACCNHAYSSLRINYQSIHQKVPQITGSTVRRTVQSFAIREQKRITNINFNSWPSNHPCSI